MVSNVSPDSLSSHMTKMPLNAEEGGAETTLTPASGQKKEEDEEEAAAKLYAVELLRTSAVPMVLKAVIELGVLEIIAEAGPGASLSASEIASRLPQAVTNPDAPATLDRLLRFLACHSILTCSSPDGTAERLYGLGRLCKFFTKSQDFGVSLASFCLMNHHSLFMDSWYHLKDALVEGGVPFNMAHGMTLSEYQQTDPQFNKVFNDGMSDYSAITMKKILRNYTGFQGLGSVVHVGGGAGANLGMLVSKYPSIKGINFDLPHVIREAPMYSGVEHVAGDMFESVPKGDAIFMKWICHNWSDEHCLKLLKNCYDALPNNGKVIVAECILPVAPDASLATKGVVHIDVMMLAHNPDGKERTEKEFQALAKGAAFQGFRVVCSAFNTYVMEFLK